MSGFRNLQKLLNFQIYNHKGASFNFIRLLSGPAPQYDERDPAPVFFNPDVQKLLKQLTRMNFNKIFKPKKLEEPVLSAPIYKFMTTEELEELRQNAQKQAEELLQMPPVIKIRKPIEKVLIKDPALQGYQSSKFVFTDITFGVKDKDRLIVVRDPDGTLKEADWDLRDRLNQVYFPKVGRRLNVPRMFDGEFLDGILNRNEYEFVLDRACVQYEPNNPEYHRVTATTYQHINEQSAFQKLRSTRHFGPLVFYLVWFNNIDNLLLELIETSQIEEIYNLLKLYQKVHQVNLNIEDSSSLEGIKHFILQFAHKKSSLELALQAYQDLQEQSRRAVQ